MYTPYVSVHVPGLSGGSQVTEIEFSVLFITVRFLGDEGGTVKIKNEG